MNKLQIMVKVLYSVSFLLLLLTAHGQVKTTTIFGTSDTLVTMTLFRVNQNGISNVNDTIKIRANNTLEQKLAINTPTFAQLTLHKKSKITYKLWLLPGSKLRVGLKKNDITFTGTGSNFANYYKKKDIVIDRYRKDYILRHPDYRDNADNVLSYTDYVTAQEELFIGSYFTKVERSTPQVKQFLQIERASTLYSNLYSKLLFFFFVIERFKFAQYGLKVDKPAYKYSEKIDFENFSLLSNPLYQAFARQFVADITLEKQKAGGKPFDIEPYVDIAMQTVDELTQKDDMAIEIKALLLNKIIEEIAIDRKDKWIPKIQATLNTLLEKNENERLQLLQTKLNNIIADTRFKKGNSAPDFVLKDRSGKEYRLADFKGKKVLIDIAAKWCGPCMAGIPSWNALIQSFQTNDQIAFISLSLDETEEDWQKWTIQRKPKGLLLNAGFKGFKSEFAKSYLVTSIPKLILLDEEGKIDEYDAPAPDSKEIREMLKLKR